MQDFDKQTLLNSFSQIGCLFIYKHSAIIPINKPNIIRIKQMLTDLLLELFLQN